MGTILLIDDSATFLHCAEAIVKQALPEIEVEKAFSGREGLEIARTGRPDVILLDLFMPDMDGMETCELLKKDETTKGIPVIMVTGHQREDAVLAPALEMGADGYLYKPFPPRQLVALIKVMLRIKRMEDALRQENLTLLKEIERNSEELRLSRELLDVKTEWMEETVRSETEDLIRQDRMMHMGLLATGVAHEINNPATFIGSNLLTFKKYWAHVENVLESLTEEATRRDAKLGVVLEEMPKLIAGMENGVKRISGIVSEIKNYSSRQIESHRKVQLRNVIETAAELTRSSVKHHAELRCELPEDLPAIHGSSLMLSQVFVNLLINAAKAIEDTGQFGEILVEAKVVDGDMEIKVQDNGSGIDAENLPLLFNPFFTTRRDQGGTGLGLFVSHGIVKGHGGDIRVESVSGVGTTFIITLPVADPAESEANDLNSERIDETEEQ